MERKIRFLIFFLVLGAMFFSLSFCLADESTSTVVVPPEEVEAPPSSGGGMPAAWFMPPAPPSEGFAILINNGAEYTNSPIVTLTLFGGPDTARMAISSFPDFRDAGQEPYITSKTWDLCKGRTSCAEGEYTVYAKFYAPWGMSSKVVSDSIIYKKTAAESIVEQIQTKVSEISGKITDLRNRIVQLFIEEETVVEIPQVPPEEISPEEASPEEIIPPAEELPQAEVISSLKEIPPEKEKAGVFDTLKESGKWLWQKIIDFWQKIWPF